MNTSPTVVDLGSELLIDRSTVREPHLRLVLTALGEPLVRHSPWVAIRKEIAATYPLPARLMRPSALPCVA
jgi:hypothetical protein